MHDEQCAVGCQQFLELDVLTRRQGVAVLQQQPAYALDHAPGRLVGAQFIGAVHAHAVDHLAAVLDHQVSTQ
jgi:hypothetical protein